MTYKDFYGFALERQRNAWILKNFRRSFVSDAPPPIRRVFVRRDSETLPNLG